MSGRVPAAVDHQAAQERVRFRYIVAILGALLAALVLFSLCIGRYPIRPVVALHILWGALTGADNTSLRWWTDTEFVVVVAVRLPRVLVASIAGAGLGLSGAALQGLFRNPLVGPQAIGISSGAAWGGVLAILVGANYLGIVAAAFAFAVLALAVVFFLNRASGAQNILSIVLAGMVVSAFFASLVGLAEFFADAERQLPSIVYWLLGSFATVSRQSVVVVALPTLAAGVALFLMRWRINLLSLGDEDARALGIRVESVRWRILALTTLIVAAQVAVSGTIGWVGLVVPHIARRLVGANHQFLLPASALIGAVYLLAVDDVARSIAQQELPIGVLTALIGTPVFALVFWKSQARGWSHD